MNDEQARERRNDLTRYASRFWAGEAEIARTFFSQSRTPEEHLRWLRVQAYKELQPRPDGIILRNIATSTSSPTTTPRSSRAFHAPISCTTSSSWKKSSATTWSSPMSSTTSPGRI